MKKFSKTIIALCTILMLSPVLGVMSAQAATTQSKPEVSYDIIAQSIYMARATKSGITVRSEAADDGEMKATVAKGASYKVIDTLDDNWIRIDIGADDYGYVKIDEGMFVYETVTADADEEAKLRADVVNYALSFVGGRYVYGGSDPNSGVDCSGFTSYVMKHAAGVGLTHSSVAQVKEGQAVALSQLEPGDLVFYSSGSRIDHVAIYIGNDQIVHASSAKTGIKISSLYNSRTPVKAVRVL